MKATKTILKETKTLEGNNEQAGKI